MPASRRDVIRTLGASGALVGLGAPSLRAQDRAPKIDHTIRIAQTTIELAPGRSVETTAYNGSVPGPTLRLKEGVPVHIDVVNETKNEDIVHWHGLHVPSKPDGAVEEGSPSIAPSATLGYAFTPRPAGTRWYHSHAMAGADLSRSTYSGEYGFLLVEPASGDPGRYDREVLLAAHHWQGEWVSLQDLRKGPPPDNGLEVLYHAATLGDRLLGHGEPIRVRQGERVLFRLLNASASMGVVLALPGHRFAVVALDGNPIPRPQSVDVVRLDVGERADVVVEMNNPGVWVFGSADDMDRSMGMGVVVEYAGRQGEPQWIKPPQLVWNYAAFGRSDPAASPDETIKLTFEKIAGGRGHFNRWTINGKSWPSAEPLFAAQAGKRYRLIMTNQSGDSHPMHLHRHTFEVTKVAGAAISGLMKDTISMPRFSVAEIDFVADNPGPTFFHCHHQDHMDEGLAALIVYA